MNYLNIKFWYNFLPFYIHTTTKQLNKFYSIQFPNINYDLFSFNVDVLNNAFLSNDHNDLERSLTQK